MRASTTRTGWGCRETSGPHSASATNTRGRQQHDMPGNYFVETGPAADFSSIARNATPLRPLVAHGMASN